MMDILIKNVFIADGSGSPGFYGNVAVKNGKIAGIGALQEVEACEVIEGEGRCLAPGFIDIHRHADLRVFSAAFGEAEIFQGITTCISGNCGMSAAPCAKENDEMLYGYLEPCLGKPVHSGNFGTFGEYARQLRQLRLPVNFGNFIGSGTVRISVKGFDPSPMTADQLAAARELVAEGMEAGAFGLSMGIMYSPECYYSPEEMAEIARVAGKYGGILVTHIRGEGDSLPDSIAEVIDIADRAEIPLQISHLKAAGRNNWNKTIDQAFSLIEAARAWGQKVTCDCYPYEAGSTMLLTVIPPALLAGGVGHALEQLKSPSGRDALRSSLARPHKNWDNLVLSIGWDRVVISSVDTEENRRFVGKNIKEIAEEMGCDEVDAVCGLLIAEKGKAGIVLFSMSEQDVCEVMRKPYSMIISDSIYPASGNPHPRLYGSFPRVLSKYVREDRVLTLEEAVRKMTSMPAGLLGLKERGRIKEDFQADLVLFDLSKVKDRATYENPAQLAEGMDLVMIGGKPVLAGNSFVRRDGGRFLTKTGTSRSMIL